MKVKLVVIVAIVVGVCAIIVSGYLTPSQKNEPAHITIAVSKTPLSAPFYIAESKGYFNQFCGKVTLTDVYGGKKSFEQVIQNKADFATSSDSVITFKAFEQTDFVNYATFVVSDNDLKIIVLKESGIETSADLIGKKIGVTKGAAGDYLLSTYLAIGDVAVNQVHRVDYAPNQLDEALANKQVDAVVSWEPFAYNTMQKMAGLVNQLNTKSLHTLTFNLIGHGNKGKEEENKASCVLQSLQHAIEFMAVNPKKAMSVITQRLQVEENFVDWVWQDYVFKLSLNRSLLLNIESQARWAVEQNLVPDQEIPDYEKLLAPQALQKINPLAVSF